MIVRCPECGEPKYIAGAPVIAREFQCTICRTNLIYAPEPIMPEKESGDGGRSRSIKLAFTAVVVLLFSFVSGTMTAFANPDSVLAQPFKGTAAMITESSVMPIQLIENIRGLVAGYERNIISGAVQAMRTTEELAELPETAYSTNDMSRFPSAENALFPEYLDKQYSQFRYTLDENGLVTVDTSGATTDAARESIDAMLVRLGYDSD